MSRKLVIDDGRNERQLQLVTSIVVGRDPACDVSDDGDPLLSRRHAEFSVASGGAVVRDLGSRNGTFVNGTRVAESAIRSGDLIRIGRLRVQYLEESAQHPSASVALQPPGADEDADRTILRSAPHGDPMPGDSRPGVLSTAAAVASHGGVTGRTAASSEVVPFVLVRIVALAVVVFLAPTAGALLRPESGAAGGIAWLLPPLVAAIGVTGGVAWSIARRLTSAFGARGNGSHATATAAQHAER